MTQESVVFTQDDAEQLNMMDDLEREEFIKKAVNDYLRLDDDSRDALIKKTGAYPKINKPVPEPSDPGSPPAGRKYPISVPEELLKRLEALTGDLRDHIRAAILYQNDSERQH